MKRLFRAGVVVAFCAGVTGCAGPGASPVTAANAAPRIGSPYNARDVLAIGKSTKADVIGALGKTTVISFDSGYDVWVYSYEGDSSPKTSWLERRGNVDSATGARGNAELVVLFAPSGVVTKVRIRAAPPPGEAKGK
jgi:hypothetical protein